MIPFAAIVLSLAAVAVAPEETEAFLRDLPPGVIVERTTEATPEQRAAIGRNLGGAIARLTNSDLSVHGRRIRVNEITAADEASAAAVHAAISKMKSYPFCRRRGLAVIEFVGTDVDAALAVKTSYDLGLEKKPESVRYRVVAELAPVDAADYMACNPLFNRFLALARDGASDEIARREIAELSKGFVFGRTLLLRNPRLDGNAVHAFAPAPARSTETAARVAYEFDGLPARHGVPFVTATLDVTVDATGFRESPAPPPRSLTEATPFWPVDDPAVASLARRITAGRTTADERVAAILEWLAPGANVKYAGEAGSRWGTSRFLEQKFGRCWDFSDAFVSLARAAGVPSRQVAGWLYGSSGHVWAEYHREGRGWQQVDPTGGGRLGCGIYHVPYFTSDEGEMPIVYLSIPRIEAAPIR